MFAVDTLEVDNLCSLTLFLIFFTGYYNQGGDITMQERRPIQT